MKQKCPICHKKLKRLWNLYDRGGVLCGKYCTKRCAEADAWGPRFKVHYVEASS